jgi:glutamyl-tRNA synthetase
MSNGNVRTRFAPSPTGYMHLGNLRTAIYAYLTARSMNGKFILRIEDTDVERYVEGAVESILNTLKIIGLEYDEGPDIGGPYGPYIQSQRKDIYQFYAKKLIELKGAYYCFCKKERLEELRKIYESKKETFKYDGYCKKLSSAEINKKLEKGEPFVIRQVIPPGYTTVKDILHGTITVDNTTLDEGVLIKSDGLPTYNFANVIDDHLMEISHVIRGSEYISSAPKYDILYNAFGWQIPEYIHLPLIMKDKTHKLSKRHGDPSFEDLYNNGYLKEAIINYIVLLGWSPKDNREFFTLDELKQIFSISGLNKSPAIFNIEKLKWMNGEYIRKLPLEKFNELAMPYYKKVIHRDDIDFIKLSKHVQLRTLVLTDIPELVAFIQELPNYDASLFVNQKMKTNIQNSYENLLWLKGILQNINEWKYEVLHKVISEEISNKALKAGQVMWPLRTALSGKESSPGGAIELAEILGKNETLRRINIALEKIQALL